MGDFYLSKLNIGGEQEKPREDVKPPLQMSIN